MREDNNGKHSEAANNFAKHLKRRFPKNKIFVACEAAPLGSMQTICNVFSAYDLTYVIKKGNPVQNDGIGVPLTHQLKVRRVTPFGTRFIFLVQRLSFFLSFRQTCSARWPPT